MDDAIKTSLLKAADPPTEGYNGQHQHLQLVSLPDNYKDLPGRTCCGCGRYKPLTEFYRKVDRVESRCKKCALKAKARVYREKRARKRRAVREISWREVVESPAYKGIEDADNLIALEDLLRDFMFEVILDAS